MSEDYYRVAKAIEYLDTHFHRQPQLKELAEHVHLSPFHFQRLFQRWAGISPKRFLQYLTIDYARNLLEEAHSMLDTAYQSGLSGPGRLHDLFITVDAVTPGEYKAHGNGLKIFYGLHDSPFGKCLIAVTERGICGLSFHDDPDAGHGLALLQERWKNARLVQDQAMTLPVCQKIFGSRSTPLQLLLSGTNFQLKVWEALLQIPEGRLVSYQDIAEKIGNPTATRAVGQAVSRNPVAFLIPCHRVIRNTGRVGQYQWGITRKKSMIAWESARNSDRSVHRM